MRASREFEPEPVQVQRVRRFVVAVLQSWGVEHGDVELLVSELATNAVLHARSRFRVTVAELGGRVRVEVFDENARLPTFTLVPPDASSGRGLSLVQALAGSWGVDSHVDSGKTIWFEVPLHLHLPPELPLDPS